MELAPALPLLLIEGVSSRWPSGLVLLPASLSDRPRLTVATPRSRYPEQLGKYWLGPIDPSRPHDEPQGGYGLVKAGVNSETGERVCCKLSHLEYEGSEAQRMEIILQAGLKHPNIVDLKDIVFIF